MGALSTRVAALELRLHRHHGPCAFANVEAAHAAGVRHGGWLCIGDVMDVAEWTAAAQAQQSALCSEVPHATD